MAASNPVGYYGKLPGRGDFVTRRVSREFVEFWDTWLQNALSCSRTQLSNDWLEVYLTSPIWRFVLSAGTCGNQIWLGVVMPSVDKVGRYFPLTIVAPVSENFNPFNIVKLAARWFEKAEIVALSALEEQDFNMDEFDAQVEALAEILPNGASLNLDNDALYPKTVFTSKGWRLPVNKASMVDQSYTSLLSQLMNHRFSTYSLWWSDGSEYVEPSLLVADGLPTVEGYAAMLDGKWQQWSWDNCPVQFMPLIEHSQNEQHNDLDIPQVSLDGASRHGAKPMDNIESSIKDDWWADDEPADLPAVPIFDKEIVQTPPPNSILMEIQNSEQNSQDNTALNTLSEISQDADSKLPDLGDRDNLDDPLAQTTLLSEQEIVQVSKEHSNRNNELEEHIDPFAKTTLISESLQFTENNSAEDHEPTVDSIQETELIEPTEVATEQLAVLGTEFAAVLGDSNSQQAQDETQVAEENRELIEAGDVDKNAQVNDVPNSESESAIISEELQEKPSNQELSKRRIYRWTSAAYTDAGRVRSANEDAYLDYPSRGLWVVADGVGGHDSGGVASRMIVRQLLNVKPPSDLDTFIADVKYHVQYVNRYIFEHVSNSQEFAAGSTIAALLIYGNQAACIWAGDSRVYLNRNGVTKQITKDHSMSDEELIDNSDEFQEPINTSAENIITRAVGAEEKLELDLMQFEIQDDDALLLCSDGLYKEVSELEIDEYLNREDCQVISRGLLDLALARNARDNVSVVSVMITSD